MPPAGIGAVEKVWHELAQAFAKAGHEVLLAGKVADGAVPAHTACMRILPMRGYEATASIVCNLAKDLLYSVQVARRLESSDVIVTNSFWMPVVLTFVRRRRERVIVHVARFPKGQMWLYGRARVLQAVSSPVAAEIARQSPSMREKVRMLPYPVDLETYRPPKAARTYDDALTILYVGRLHPEKGLEVLIRAFRSVAGAIPRSRLKIVGPSSPAQGGGGEDWIDAMKTLARGLPVEFVGPIADPVRLALELQRAHCFCYPSMAEKGEAFGLSVLEAMAAGLPVVVSALECFGDLMEHGREGLVFDHRARHPEIALAACLERLLSGPGEALRLGGNAAKKAASFGVERVAARYVALFEEVCGG